MTRRTFLLSVVLFLVPSLSYASGRVIYRLAIEPPPEVAALDTEGRRAFAEQAIKRLTARLDAAGVKEHDVRIANAKTVLVETGWKHDRAWMEALLTSPGKLELRRVVAEKPDWMDLISELPEGVELRGTPIPYVWSARRSVLEPWLRRVRIPGVDVTVFPEEDGGFRSVSLGESFGTRKDLRSAKTRRSSTGSAFVLLQFRSSVAARLAAAGVSDVEEVAIVLDDQLIGFMQAETLRSQTPVRMSAPAGAVPDDRKAHRMWVQQVVGRLAAPLPIPIAVLKE